jgi:hypothetical protein
MHPIPVRSVDRHAAALAGTHPYNVVKIEDKDLSISDLSRVGRLRDSIDRPVDEVFIDRYLELDLFEKAAALFRAAVNLGATFCLPWPRTVDTVIRCTSSSSRAFLLPPACEAAQSR